VPYADLTDAEKEYDRRAAMETLKAILALGYRIAAPPRANCWPRRSSANARRNRPGHPS